MNNCRNCGKPIETGFFCSPDCSFKFEYKDEPKGKANPLAVSNASKSLEKEVKHEKEPTIQYDAEGLPEPRFGSGASRRVHNIDCVIAYLNAGKDENWIRLHMSKGFTLERINEYIQISKESVNNAKNKKQN